MDRQWAVPRPHFAHNEASRVINDFFSSNLNPPPPPTSRLDKTKCTEMQFDTQGKKIFLPSFGGARKKREN